jgi:negative regulator of sigma E activity
VVLRHQGIEVQYDPKALVGTRGARLIEDDEAFLVDRLPWLLANYEVTAAPRQLLNRPTERLVLRPRQPDRPTRRLDIDASTGVILRSERDGPDGRLTQVTAFLSFQSMPPGWRADATLPPGLRLTDRAPLRRVTPDQAWAAMGRVPVAVAVPEGFHRVADYLVSTPTPLIQTVYSDGLSVLVVSAQPGTMAQPPAGSRVITGAAGPLWTRQAGQQTLVHWAYDGWLLTMVGDLDPAALVGAAERTGVAAAPRILDHFKAWVRGLRWPF